MDASYAEVGIEVVMCFHHPPLFISEDLYYRKRTTIIEVRQHHGTSQCRVKADNGEWWWSSSNMILASEIDLLTPEQRSRIK